LDRPHDGRADDDAVGEPANGRRLLGARHAKADTERLRRHQSERADLRIEILRQLAPLAGDPGERDDVDEAARQPRDRLYAGRRALAWTGAGVGAGAANWTGPSPAGSASARSGSHSS